MPVANAVARILIVDDELPHMQALCDTLASHDYATSGVSWGAAALEALRTTRFDLLLADLTMPEMDGITLVQAARALDPELACVIMTGQGSITTAVRAMKVGALDYIVKPFKVSAILPVLARALETRTLRLRNASLERSLHERAEQLQSLNRDLELARQQADSANHAKSAFLANISHELRTPLNAILGFSQILVHESLPTTLDDKRKFARHILQSGKHLLTLINEVLDLAKVESGTMSLSLEAVAVADIFAECQAMTEPLAHTRGIALRVALPVDVFVLADRTRFKQIVLNLLSNAIKYNREHGSVNLRCEAGGSARVRISVQDTGVGLDQSQLDAIFQPFNRLGREALHEEGTGIGLSLTKCLVEAMRGEIGIDSKAGIGSTFWFQLPTCDPATHLHNNANNMVVRVARTELQSAPRTVLYIEDNPTNLQLVTELIRLRGDVVLLSSTTGAGGIERARASLPDVILLDINLPDQDGYAVLKVLRNDPRTASIPVIAVSANAMPHDLRRATSVGFFRYITKPIDIGTFADTLDRAIEERVRRLSEQETPP